MDYKDMNAIGIVRLMLTDGVIKEEQAIKYFPELKESEDERIRKKLVEVLNLNIKGAESQMQNCSGVDRAFEIEACKKGIEWLEKKGQTFTKKDIDDAYLKGVCDANHELEKQGEPTDIPADAVLDSNKDGLIVDTIRCKREKQGEQKHDDNIEPKFKVGDWIIDIQGVAFNRIINSDGESYQIETCCSNFWLPIHITEKNYRLWTIQDAKDGDVLAYVTDEEDLWIMIYQSLYEPYEGHVHYHALLVNDNFSDKGTCCICIDGLKPATKEQRDLLFRKIHEAGYTFDLEKKELKKIKQKPTQETEPFEAEHGKYYYCIKDYFCGGRKQASKGDVIQALRGLPIMGLKDASEYFLPVNSIECNPAWSEEDENMLDIIITDINYAQKFYNTSKLTSYDKKINWLKSLSPKSQWKPSDEQMYNLSEAAHYRTEFWDCDILIGLYDELKKLKG